MKSAVEIDENGLKIKVFYIESDLLKVNYIQNNFQDLQQQALNDKCDGFTVRVID